MSVSRRADAAVAVFWWRPGRERRRVGAGPATHVDEARELAKRHLTRVGPAGGEAGGGFGRLDEEGIVAPDGQGVARRERPDPAALREKALPRHEARPGGVMARDEPPGRGVDLQHRDAARDAGGRIVGVRRQKTPAVAPEPGAAGAAEGRPLALEEEADPVGLGSRRRNDALGEHEEPRSRRDGEHEKGSRGPMKRDSVREKGGRLGGAHEARDGHERRHEKRERHDVQDDRGEEGLVVTQDERRRRPMPRDVVGDLEVIDQDVERGNRDDDEGEDAEEPPRDVAVDEEKARPGRAPAPGAPTPRGAGRLNGGRRCRRDRRSGGLHRQGEDGLVPPHAGEREDAERQEEEVRQPHRESR